MPIKKGYAHMAEVKTGARAGKLAEGGHCLGIWRFYLEADEDEEKDDLDHDDGDVDALTRMLLIMTFLS